MPSEATQSEPLRSGRLFGHLARLPPKTRCDFCGPRTGSRPVARVRLDLGVCDVCKECRDGLIVPIRAEMALPNIPVRDGEDRASHSPAT